MGLFSWLFPTPATPDFMDPSLVQHLFAITFIGVFFLILGAMMLHPKAYVPGNSKFRFVVMLGMWAIGVAFLMGVF